MYSFIRAVRNLIVSAQSGTNLNNAIETCEEQIKLAGMLNEQHGISIQAWPMSGTGCYMISVMIAKNGKVTGASVSLSDAGLREAADKKAYLISHLEELMTKLKAS